MAKIAVALDQPLARRPIANGDGWTVADMVCTSGPGDRRFEERHTDVGIAIVVAGSFQYRSAAGQALMTPGSLLLGNAGQCFECGHEHGVGDRCLSFRYAPEYFEGLAGDAGFRVPRVPPLRALSPLIARACAGLAGSADVPWEELSVQLAVQTLQVLGGRVSEPSRAAPGTVARVTRIVRRIERYPDARLALGDLAREAGLSPYHFLRTFERLTGVTPHQFVLRTRLRQAAMRLAAGPEPVLHIALDCGFGDLSNFNRSFRAEFGASPRVYRRQTRTSDRARSATGRRRVP